MFEMSVNEVPDWSVTMPPRLIGVPVATTPGLVPHDEVLTAELVGLDEADAAAPVFVEEVAGELEVLDVVEEELHPATTPRAIAARAAAPVRVRQWTDLFICSAFS